MIERTLSPPRFVQACERLWKGQEGPTTGGMVGPTPLASNSLASRIEGHRDRLPPSVSNAVACVGIVHNVEKRAGPSPDFHQSRLSNRTKVATEALSDFDFRIILGS